MVVMAYPPIFMDYANKLRQSLGIMAYFLTIKKGHGLTCPFLMVLSWRVTFYVTPLSSKGVAYKSIPPQKNGTLTSRLPIYTAINNLKFKVSN